MPMRSHVVDRLLRPFSKVRPGEGPLALLMLLCVFLILTSYYLMKPAREGLILAGGAWGLEGDELKTYANGAMALVLVVLVPAYGALANRVRRIRLINVSYALVIASLVLFFALARAGLPIGVAFFVWLGLVSVFLIAQFWSYANDVYTEEQGKRLFAIIAIGGSLGAIFGPRIAKLADTYTLLVIAAFVLAGCLVLFNLIEHVHSHRTLDLTATAPIEGPGGFHLVLRDRYLLLIAAMLLVANLVNTTGEYILSNAARDHAMAVAPGDDDAQRELIKGFYSDFFMWVNLASFVIQALLVSRIIEKLGVRAALFVMPIIAFGGYGLIGAVGGFALVRAAKIAENSTDYSLQNTVRQALFLPTDRAAKYKAKAAIDTFFVRLGDTLSAVLVGVGIHQLGFGGRQFALVNLLLIGVWVLIAAGIARRHRRLSPDKKGARPDKQG
jgi:ATP:ADP antiporter, AAA family